MRTLKSILFIALTFVSFTVFSQTEKENKSKFSIGISAGPNFSNWYYKSNNSSGEIKTRGDFFENFDGLSLGLVGEYKFNNKLSLKAGLLTSNTISIERFYGDPINPGPDNSVPISIRNSYHYINIPIILRFNYFEYEEIKLFVNGGLINKVLLYTNGWITYDDSNEEVPGSRSCDFTNHFEYILGLNIETGLEYKFNEDFNLRFYPSFEMSFLSVYDKDYFAKSYILMGLNFSFIYNL